MDTFTIIPQDDPVLLLNAFVEGLDLSKLYQAYSRFGRIEYSPKVLLKILLFGYMRKIYSSYELRRACEENTKFMYLLEGLPPPSESTICRFRRNCMSEYGEDLLVQMARKLEVAGLLSFENVFIDGTKMEANANRYSFVWRKTTKKNYEKLQAKMQECLPELLRAEHIRYTLPKEVSSRNLSNVLKKLHKKKQQEKVEFVYGTGTRKTTLQRTTETVEGWLERLEKYEKAFAVFRGRNSFSKTDPDATFMHMKEDHMRNGQLKPGYNVNAAVASGFIIGNYISPDRSDIATLIPFSEKLLKHYKIQNVVVDSGYESEENYTYYENLADTELWVKPSNYEQQKKRKYKNDISRKENMDYDEIEDIYYCVAGKPLFNVQSKWERTNTGYLRETTIYECPSCHGCPLKERCIRSRSKVPLEERNKRIYVSKAFQKHRKEMLQKIATTKGKILRVNRSIQAEGQFAVIKEDMQFRRFMLRGEGKVEAEWLLLSMAYNLLKLDHKLKKGRLGAGLIIPSTFPAGL